MSNSPSEPMMNAGFEAMGVDASYETANVKPTELATTFASLRKDGVSGMNVTIPHKLAICGLLDSMDKISRSTGAVNTVKKSDGSYSGFNTDVAGIVNPLRRRGIGRVKKSVALGTGGTARAFCGAMNIMKCGELTFLSRNPQGRRDFLNQMRNSFPTIQVQVSSLTDPPGTEPDLVFNASPAVSGEGVPQSIAKLLEGHPLVFDAVYFPVETELLREASRLGCPVVRGHEMLLGQGLEAFRIWAGLDPPASAMKGALLRSLGAAS